MLKQSPSRTQRSKGFKIKHVLQIVVLLAIGVWLLNQLKRSYNKSDIHEEATAKTSEKVLREHEVRIFGRKDLLHPRVEDSSSLEAGNRAESGGATEDVKDEYMEDEGRGGGDDEIDGIDQEKVEEEESEEVEDLIDIEDGEREEGSEEQENEDKGTHLEHGRSADMQEQRR